MSKTDPPENYSQFFFRVVVPGMHRDLTIGEMHEEYDEMYQPMWEEAEKEKSDFRKTLEREGKDHDKQVERLKIEIERQKERIRREAVKKREQEQRKAEQEAERERRDPTPEIQPAQELNIPQDVRSRHIFVPGGSGYGKSAQLSQIIASDIAKGHSLIVIDPKGDLIRRICAYLPEKDFSRTIYIDMQHPIPIDVLGKHGNPDYLVGDIKQLVIKGNQTLDRASPLLSRLVHSLIRVPHASFLDIQYFFTRPDRQKAILDTLKETQPFYYNLCVNEVVRAPYGEYSPLTNRMTDFSLYENLNTILGHPQPPFNLIRAINENKIILLNLGGTGEPRKIFGTLFISQLQQAALSRAGSDKRHFLPENQRPPICFYVDEFETFQTATFHEIISVARGLGLHITVATPTISQITKEIRDAIFDIFSTHIIFHLELNLDLYENRMRPYNVKRLAELKQFQAVFKIGDDAPVFRWTKAPPPFGDKENDRATVMIDRLIEQTQSAYGPNAPSAESGQKRSGDNEACNPTQVRQTEGNASNSKSEDIQPGGAPRPKTL